ncbi:MAG TPA: NUDIX hydrolase [Candidatus Paceibacterota bacterium]|nr:NUDIX hydrolase [Candidatus Paceibacterota bacterium]
MKDGEKHFEGKVSCKGVIVSPQGRVVVCRNAHDQDFWDLPGGVLNTGETLEEGLVREIREEIGVEPTIGKILGAWTFTKRNSGKQTVAIAFLGALEETARFSFDDGEIAEVRWIGKEDLKEIRLFPEYHRILEDFFAQ